MAGHFGELRELNEMNTVKRDISSSVNERSTKVTLPNGVKENGVHDKVRRLRSILELCFVLPSIDASGVQCVYVILITGFCGFFCLLFSSLRVEDPPSPSPTLQALRSNRLVDNVHGLCCCACSCPLACCL